MQFFTLTEYSRHLYKTESATYCSFMKSDRKIRLRGGKNVGLCCMLIMKLKDNPYLFRMLTRVTTKKSINIYQTNAVLQTAVKNLHFYASLLGGATSTIIADVIEEIVMKMSNGKSLRNINLTIVRNLMCVRNSASSLLFG